MNSQTVLEALSMRLRSLERDIADGGPAMDAAGHGEVGQQQDAGAQRQRLAPKHSGRAWGGAWQRVERSQGRQDGPAPGTTGQGHAAPGL